MLPVLLLMLVTQVQPEVAWLGEITAATGELTLVRSGKPYQTGYHAGILSQDSLETGPASGASFFLEQGPYVYLGASTSVTISGGPAKWTIDVKQGEVRIASRGGAILTALTPSSEIEMESAIVRVFVHPRDGTRVASEYGTSKVRGRQAKAAQGQPGQTRLASYAPGAGPQEIELGSGQEISISPTGELGQPHVATGENWSIDAKKLQLQSIVDATRRQLRKLAADTNPPETEERTDETAARAANQQARIVEGQSLVSTGASLQIGFGSLASASPASFSAGLFSDSAQDTLQGQLTQDYQNLLVGDPFPGNIHLVTGESLYGLANVQLNAAEQVALFGGGPAYFSIGAGALPTTQVQTDYFTGTGPSPNPIPVPGFDNYVVQLTQYNALDATLDPAAGNANNVGYSGLLGQTPSGPTVTGATPLLDNRAQLNHTATFALGEIRLMGIGPHNTLQLSIRQSDQDRLIVKDPNGNDAHDQVTVNTLVTSFDNVADPRFQPAAPTVKVPSPSSYTPNTTEYKNLDPVRQAAVTTVLADQLYDYATRTGQTRFVVDGKIIDIKGYHK